MTEEEWQKQFKDRKVVGLTEDIEIYGKNGKPIKVKARIDTGATRSSVDAKLAKELQLGPVVRTKVVKQAHGHTIRPIVMAEFRLAGEVQKNEFTIAERSHMRFKVLIGQNGLKNGYLVDPNQK